MAALLLTLLPLALLWAGHSDAFDLFGPYPGISCPSGFDIIPQRTGGGLYCRGDPCVGNPCGAGEYTLPVPLLNPFSSNERASEIEMLPRSHLKRWG